MTNPSQGLLFSFAEMQKEANNMAKVASRFLDSDNDAEGVIKEWVKQLEQFGLRDPGSELQWEISLGRPIRTIPSNGYYERDGKGAHSVYATISSIWDIAIPTPSGPTPKRGTPKQVFEIVGKASTRISVLCAPNGGNLCELARWRFEIGTSCSPGCHFHAQILGEENDRVFPKSMPVPRLPGLLFTPMDALEFVLAELFQDEWARHAAKETEAIKVWATCQKRRLIKLLQWQQDRLEKSSGSPWTALKADKPDATLLVCGE